MPGIATAKVFPKPNEVLTGAGGIWEAELDSPFAQSELFDPRPRPSLDTELALCSNLVAILYVLKAVRSLEGARADSQNQNTDTGNLE